VSCIYAMEWMTAADQITSRAHEKGARMFTPKIGFIGESGKDYSACWCAATILGARATARAEWDWKYQSTAGLDKPVDRRQSGR